MKTHTSDFKNEIKKFGRQLDSIITYEEDGETIELGKEQLNSITPHYEGSILKSTMRQLDIDSNVEIPLETIINYQFGLKIDNEYEYLNYGNYVVYKVEKQEDTNSYKITCYDKMLYSMIPYEAMNITYPITIRNYLGAICDKLGLTLKSGNFANEDQLIQSELYLDSEGNSLDYTFRDVLDEIAGATGSTICINEDTDELEVRYVSNTGTQTTVEGTSISIENSDDEKIDLTLQGNTTQETTPTSSSPQPINVVSGRQEITISNGIDSQSYEINLGKNLLENNIETQTKNDVVFTVNQDKTITANGLASANISIDIGRNIGKIFQAGTYTASGCYANGNSSTYYVEVYKVISGSASRITTLYGKSNDVSTFTLTENCEVFYRLNVRNGYNAKNILFKPMIEKGSVATPYSPYKTPIELCKIGDYQDFIKKGTGKNLFDKNNANILNCYINGNVITASDYNRLLYIECKPDTTYTIQKIASPNTRQIAYTTELPENNGQVYGRIDIDANKTTGTITTGSDAKYLVCRFYQTTQDSSTSLEKMLDSIQIEEGTIATSYEPYGMYNKWYIEKNIGKVVLDGTQDLYKTATGTSGYSRYNIDIGTNIYSTDTPTEKAPMYCNRLVGGTRGNTYSRIECIAPTTNNYSYKSFNFYIEALAQMTNAQVNNWLASNNMIVYYPYKTPTYTEITDSELIGQLNAPRLLEGLNNVSVSSGDLGSPIKITYTSELDTIDEEYLKDINVNFGEKFGKVNSIVLSRSAESDNIYLRDEESVLENGLCEIKIKDNQIMNNNDRYQFLPGLLEALDGLEYYINDFASPGVLYYNLCDKYKVKVGNNYYKCIMFNDEVNVTQGLEENIYTEMPEESETDYTKSDKTDKKINQAYIIVDKQVGQIESRVSKTETDIKSLDSRTTANEGSITELTSLTQDYSSIKATVQSLDETVNTDGVSKVKTTSVTIDNQGLSVATNTSKISTQITNNSFEIRDSGDNTIAFFGYDEVEQTSKAEMDNLTVKTYFVAGVHRTEKYEENFEERTGWFYIGG